jgi:hypothetical protein
MTDVLQRVPTRYRALCEFCQNVLDTRTDGTHQFVSGWVKNRSQGGGHGVSLPHRENRWAHAYCVERASRNSSNQGLLL